MNGQMSICQICAYQDRRVDDGQNAGCVLPHPVTDYDTCDAFDLLQGRPLGARLAELYNLVDLAWDMIMTLLDGSEGGTSTLIRYRLTDKGRAAIE